MPSSQLQLIQSIKTHDDTIWAVSWSPNGKFLASCSADKTVKIWQLSSAADASSSQQPQLACIATLDGGTHNRTIRNVEWSPDGRFLACASFDGTTSVWRFNQQQRRKATDGSDDMEDSIMNDSINDSDELFECVSTLEGHENEVKSVAWDCTGNLLATCGRDKTVWIWELINNDEEDSYDTSAVEFDCVSVLNGHTQDVKQVKWHPAGREVLASASYDDTVRMWIAGSSADDDDWYCADTLRQHRHTVWSIDFSADGSRLVSAGADLDVVIWRCFDATAANSASTIGVTALAEKPFVWKPICTISGYHERSIYSVSWSQVSKDLIATAAGDDALRVFRIVDGADTDAEASFELVAEQKQAHATDVNCVRWHPTDANLLVSCSDDCSIKLWRCQEK